MAAQTTVAVQGQADVAVRAAKAAATGAAVQGGSRTTPVEQEDRATTLVGQRAEAVAQRAREGVVRVAAQVDDLDLGQRAAHA